MQPKFLIRPIKQDDLKEILELAEKTGPGMTSLPADLKLLGDKIQNSVNSFKIEPAKPGDESYRFVLEDLEKKQLVGIAAITARIGGYEAFYSYEIKKARHVSEKLGVDKEVEYLELKKEHDGPSLIGSLFLDPEYRGSGLGKILSQARFFFMANFPKRFAESIIAEMRGVIDKDAQSPFWNGTVRNFFDMDFTKADYLSITDKGFIADLMPKYPLYIPLMREATQAAIGKVHEKTKPALDFLLSEGFKPDGHVDIFDAGPRIEAKISDIKTIKESKTVKLKAIVKTLADDLETYLISNTAIDFRFTKAKLLIEADGVSMEEGTAKLLNLELGSELRYL